MSAEVLAQALAEVQARWVYNRVYPNVDGKGQRRRDDVPWNGLVVIGDFGATEGHECVIYHHVEGCSQEGHDNYQFVGWIDVLGGVHYVAAAGLGQPHRGRQL